MAGEPYCDEEPSGDPPYSGPDQGRLPAGRNGEGLHAMKTLLANLRSCVIALFAMTAVCLNGQKTVQLPAVASYNEAYVLTPDQPQGEGQISIDGSHVEVRFTSV